MESFNKSNDGINGIDKVFVTFLTVKHEFF